MARANKLQETLNDVRVKSVRAVFMPKWVRAEWDGVGADELRECHVPEVSMTVGSKEVVFEMGRMPKASPGDVPIGPAAEMIRAVVGDTEKIRLNRLEDVLVKESLVRVMGAVITKFEESLRAVLKDPKAFEAVNTSLQRKKKRMTVKALQSVFRRAVEHLTTEEVTEMWNLAQVESVLKS